MTSKQTKAFPRVSTTGCNSEGMTLRQYYAAKLIAPMVFSSNNGTSLEQDVAKAFEIADAMINFEEQGK